MGQHDVWLDRSKTSRNQKYKGVLFRNFPDLLNDYLHKWTAQLVTSHIIAEDKNILDIGCGYGRVSIKIREKYPDARLVGVEISPFYAKEYTYHVQAGSALLSDSVLLPFKKGSFQIIFEVFSLMYLPDKRSYRQAVQEMFYALTEKGSIFIIENNRLGTFFLSGFGLFSLFSKFTGGKKKELTKGLIFDAREIDFIIQHNRGIVMKKCGMPLFTLFIPLGVLISFVSSKLLRKILFLINQLDPLFEFLSFLSLFHFYWIRKRQGNGYHT